MPYHDAVAERGGGCAAEPDSPFSVALLPLQIIVMAAGRGKRMHSARPKALHALAGRPLVAHVLDAVRALAPRALALVVGHAGEAIRAALAAPDLAFVTQDPPRGTGDAVRIALAALRDEGVTLVVNGDCPLIPAATFAAVVEIARAGKLAMLTARVKDPSGLGRVVRDPAGAVRLIVEDKDASAAAARACTMRSTAASCARSLTPSTSVSSAATRASTATPSRAAIGTTPVR